MEDQNLIPFPVDRVKKRRQPGTTLDLRSLTSDPRRSGALLSIVSVILLSMSLNPSLTSLAEGGRSIASTPESAKYDREIQARLEKEFRGQARLPASVGREPTTEDKLRAGELRGRYRLVYRDEYIAEIALIDDKMEPIILKDGPKEFLENYRTIIHPGYDSVEPLQISDGEGHRQQTFQLKKDGQDVGRVHLKLDRFGRFYSMNVE